MLGSFLSAPSLLPGTVPCDPDEPFGALIEAGPEWSPEARIMRRQMRRLVRQAMRATLNAQEHLVVRLMFGFWGDRWGAGQIAARYGMSKQRVYQVRKSAIVKLRSYLVFVIKGNVRPPWRPCRPDLRRRSIAMLARTPVRRFMPEHP